LSNFVQVVQQEAQLMLTTGSTRSVEVNKHSTIPYIRYGFLLNNSNFVFQTRPFYDIRVVTLNSGSKVTQGH